MAEESIFEPDAEEEHVEVEEELVHEKIGSSLAQVAVVAALLLELVVVELVVAVQVDDRDKDDVIGFPISLVGVQIITSLSICLFSSSIGGSVMGGNG